VKLDDVKALVAALNGAGVRYLVVGGLAVVIHGHERLTMDMDLVIQLDRPNVLAAFTALASLGYVPRVPVTGEQFADTVTRERWIAEKGMQVLNLWSDNHPKTPVDLFVREPCDFDAEYAAAREETLLAPGTSFRVVRLATLIGMKRVAAREKDLEDVRSLEALNDET
jgi:predicted nucleotidyltransferase